MSQAPSMQPTGWFQVAWSGDAPAGAVKPLRYFGNDMVIFRGVNGQVSVLDAHCEHLGANLARGGCVVEDGILCPFHGWVWSGEGRNVRIPYEPRPNRARRIRAWRVTELNDCIFIWHDAQGREPLWQLPDWKHLLNADVAAQDYRPLGDDERELFSHVKVHPQIIAENAVDPHHFRFVHGTPISPVVLRETIDEHVWHAKVGFGRRWADGVDRQGDNRNTIEIYWSGLGYVINGESTADGVRVIAINATPVGDGTCDIFASYWISGSDNYAERLKQAKAALPDDIHIWKYQKYMDKPALTPSEAEGFYKLRSWARSFYPAEPVAVSG
ncbi:MAG: Rieske 2Fe-2S domain-containing protein [Mycobacterium sp.]|nr:Rieske 2Fe-2S domain-containing protein [Mycobacterium sp.]HKI43304.1 Rieske 2Fe-2S domain-containing protein [Mycobacterium sp.]